jgi:hypothetical protein
MTDRVNHLPLPDWSQPEEVSMAKKKTPQEEDQEVEINSRICVGGLMGWPNTGQHWPFYIAASNRSQ